MRRQNQVRVVVVVCIFVSNLFLPGTQSFAENQKNFMWRARSEDGIVYILGSIHMLKKDVYPLNKTIEDAFDRSDILAVEANVQDMNGLDIRKMMAQAFYPEGDMLENHISPETLAMIKDEARKLGLRFDVLHTQRPWFLALSLQAMALIKCGYDPKFGIDNHFLLEARGKKKITELEGLTDQVDLMTGFSEAEQELVLQQTLKDLDLAVREAQQLTDAWKSGDVATIEEITARTLRQDSRLYPVYKKLLFDRNKSMAAKIENALKAGQRCFTVIGAAHLVGEKGIIHLLEERGYAVEQM